MGCKKTITMNLRSNRKLYDHVRNLTVHVEKPESWSWIILGNWIESYLIQG